MPPTPRAGQPVRDSHLVLVKKSPLVSIQNERQFSAAQKVVDGLLQEGKLSTGEEEYLDVLSDLIALYESVHYDFPAVSAANLLEHLLEARGTTQAALSRDTGIPRSTVSELLSGKRAVSLNHIGPLARHFRVPPSVFLPEGIAG